METIKKHNTPLTPLDRGEGLETQNTDKKQTPRIKEIIDACLSFERDFYSLSQVVLKTLIGRDIVRHKLWKLETAGLITRVNCFETRLPEFSNGRPTKEICYRNTKLLKEKAEGTEAQRHKENGWDKMWKAIRALRKFTRSDLTSICGESIYNVRFFTKKYRAMGYIKPLRKGGPGVTWMIVKDPGPRRPLCKKSEKGGNSGEEEINHVD